MHKISYFIENKIIEIFRPQHIGGMYRIKWDSFYIGYIYVSHIDIESGTQVWAASSAYTKLYAEELGKLIESCDMML